MIVIYVSEQAQSIIENSRKKFVHRTRNWSVARDKKKTLRKCTKEKWLKKWNTGGIGEERR